MPDVNPTAFEVYNHWVYNQKLDMSFIDARWQPNYCHLLAIWLLADYLGDTELCK